jgi:hypothetical protein
MKRLCLILAYLFLFTQTASAMPLLVGQKVVYRGTIAGLRISAVDGTAFIDNLPYTYSSDFSAGVDGWSAIQGTAAGNIDSIGGEDNWLRFTIDTGNISHYWDKTLTFVKGRKYNVTFTYYIPSSQSNIDGVRFFENSGNKTISPILTVVDSATTVSYTLTSVGSSSIRFCAYDGDLVKFQDPGGDDVFYIKDIKISEIQPYADGNHQIEIYDSSNRMLKGVLKAAGTSETLDPDLLAGWNLTSGWSTTKASITDADTFTATANDNSYAYKGAGTLSLESLYKGTFLAVSSAGRQAYIRNGNTAVTYVPNGTTKYFTCNTDSWLAIGHLSNTIGQYLDITTMTIQQVTAPSSSGCTIVSAKGGEVYNFSYKNASFTYNAASYYVIIRAIR